jgi:hypothetical protein
VAFGGGEIRVLAYSKKSHLSLEFVVVYNSDTSSYNQPVHAFDPSHIPAEQELATMRYHSFGFGYTATDKAGEQSPGFKPRNTHSLIIPAEEYSLLALAALCYLLLDLLFRLTGEIGLRAYPVRPIPNAYSLH